MILTEQTARDLHLCDATLLGIGWANDGRDVEIGLILGDGQRAMLRCTWALAVTIDIRFDSDRAGTALSWDSEFERTEHGWRVSLEFPPEGSIVLQCHTIELIHDEASSRDRTET